MRVAMIGAGGVAQRHARVLSGIEGVRVVTVADVFAPAAEALAGVVGASAHTEVEAALDDQTLDAAYVCVPPFAHGHAEGAILDRGLPMFVEKPVALDLEIAEHIAARVADGKVVTGTGYHWRCLDTVDRASAQLAESTPLLGQGWWLDRRPPVDWWQQRSRSGGQVIEQLAHVLDLARLLLGEPVEVHAGAANRAPDASGTPLDPDHVDDATAAFVRFDSGAILTLAATCALSAKHGAGLAVVAPGLHLLIGEEALEIDLGGQKERIEPTVDPREAVDREFVATVRGERETTRSPYADALASHRFAMAIDESARSGRTVRLDPPGGSQVAG